MFVFFNKKTPDVIFSSLGSGNKPHYWGKQKTRTLVESKSERRMYGRTHVERNALRMRPLVSREVVRRFPVLLRIA